MADANGFPDLVRELMTVGVFTCTAETPIVDLVPHFLEKSLEEAVVMEDGNAIGVIGQVEMVRAMESADWKALKVEDLMREDFLVIKPDITIIEAVKIMQEKNVRAAYLMHNAAGRIYPAGIITYNNILHLLAAKKPEDLNALGFNAARVSPLEAFIQKRDAAKRKSQSGMR